MAGFQRAEDYVACMSDPSRVVHVEWRKVRHEKSRGFTSHSWLEIRLSDERRLRLEIYADRGYTELSFDPRGLQSPNFFDPESTIYDGRVANERELSRVVTAEMLRSEAKALANRHYKLSEFNCHHFVLELWNSMVVEPLQSQHYPDRAKIGLLWGFEGIWGQWLQAAASTSAPAASLVSLGTGPMPLREVFLLETTGPMRRAEAEVPQAWAQRHLPGLEEAGLRVASLISSFSMDEENAKAKASLVASLVASVSSVSSVSSASWELCFVVLRGKELRLAVMAVGPQRLLLLSGDALRFREGEWTQRLERHELTASQRAFQLKEDLQQALRRSDWRLPKISETFRDV